MTFNLRSRIVKRIASILIKLMDISHRHDSLMRTCWTPPDLMAVYWTVRVVKKTVCLVMAYPQRIRAISNGYNVLTSINNIIKSSLGIRNRITESLSRSWSRNPSSLTPTASKTILNRTWKSETHSPMSHKFIHVMIHRNSMKRLNNKITSAWLFKVHTSMKIGPRRTSALRFKILKMIVSKKDILKWWLSQRITIIWFCRTWNWRRREQVQWERGWHKETWFCNCSLSLWNQLLNK